MIYASNFFKLAVRSKILVILEKFSLKSVVYANFFVTLHSTN